MIPLEFKEHRVIHEVLETCYEDYLQGIDQFITENSYDSWRYKLTQAEDVSEWIKDPTQITRIKSSLQDLKSVLKSMRKPLNILDVGCYGGYIYDYMSRFIFNSENDFSYTGLDIREIAIEGARKAHKNLKNASFIVGNIYELKNTFAEGTFDVVFCSRVLIHIPFFEKAISNLLDMAKDVVFMVLKIEEKPCCKKMKKTDIDSKDEMIYFYRSFSPEMIYKVAKNHSVKCRILKNSGGYSSVLFFKTSESGNQCINFFRSLSRGLFR